MTLMEQTAWVCGVLSVATAALVFAGWWLWYPPPPDEPEGE